MVKTPALYTKGRRFELHSRRFSTPTVVLLSFDKPETVLWTIAKILLLILSAIYLESFKSKFLNHFGIDNKYVSCKSRDQNATICSKKFTIHLILMNHDPQVFRSFGCVMKIGTYLGICKFPLVFTSRHLFTYLSSLFIYRKRQTTVH